jgi:hypothetical protein
VLLPDDSAGAFLYFKEGIRMKRRMVVSFWQSGGETELPMASTTKVMATPCVLDNANLGDTFTVDFVFSRRESA